jgi:hypothetical protein
MADSKKKKALFIIGSFVILAAVYFLFFMNSSPPAGEDPVNLLGKWVRTDASFTIEVISVDKNGTAKAAYFNPNPIHVGSAKWEVYKAQLYLYVEMQDVNYPGSNYTLIYDPISEKLTGSYYQAVAGQTYTVEFVKSK